MQFYVEGLELDVQDPTFFMDEKNYQETLESIEEMLDIKQALLADQK